MKSFLMNKKINKIVIFLNTIIMSLSFFNINVYASGYASTQVDFLKKMQPFFKEYGFILNSFVAVVILSNFIIFIYHFCKLGAQACDHPLIRKQVINDLVISGICLALIGGAGTIYTILFTIIMK